MLSGIFDKLNIAFGHCGDISTALQVMEEMASNHLPITTETFNFLLHGCISLRTDGFSHALLVGNIFSVFC